jgi:hypothetical protein
MGSGRWDADDWKSYSTTRSYDTKSRAEIFESKSLNKDLSPKGVNRESRDSNDNPNSTAIIIAQDVTGSMGMISEVMVRQGIPTLLKEIYDRKPVSDPHVMCAAIGDVEYDDAPLQVTQFEADIRISEQLEKFYLEGGGGGNCYESYALAWYFAAYHTSIDCFEKRGKKGYLFTIGDEEPTKCLTKEAVKGFIGDDLEVDVDMDSLLTLVSRKYEIYHIIVEEGSYCNRYPLKTREAWIKKLGQRAIRLKDHTKLAEVIVSLIQFNEGTEYDKVVGSWDGSTSLVVADSLKDLKSKSDDENIVIL